MQLDLFLDHGPSFWVEFYRRHATKEEIKQHGGIRKALQKGYELRATQLGLTVKQYKEQIWQS